MVESTFQGTPEWYGGKEGILKQLVERAEAESRAKYEPFRGERIAEFTPLQQQGFRIAQEAATTGQYPGVYNQALEGIGRAQEARSINPQFNLEPYLQAGTQAPTRDVLQQYMNPYQEAVVNQIGQLGARNLRENLLPSVQNQFIGAGQYGSTGHQNFTNRAVRDVAEDTSRRQAEALYGGYNNAQQAALAQQGRQLEAGQLGATTRARDIERQLAASEALPGIAQAQQAQQLRGAGALSQLGGQQQQQRQNERNTQYQAFAEERAFPFQQTARLSEISRGLPVNTQAYQNTFQPQPPQASPWSQGAGLFAGAYGANQMRQAGQGIPYATGGHVQEPKKHYRHYADGGSLSPIQQGANDAIDTAELQSMRNQANRFQQPQVDPFWASIARGGFNLAANTRPNTLANIGEAAQAGLGEYHNQLATQGGRELESAKIMEMIDKTKRWQAEKNREHQFKQQEFGEKQRQFGLTHGIHAGQLGLQRERLEHEKKLYEEGLKGNKGKTEASPYKKSNETAIEEARKSISTIPALKSNLKSLKELAEKLDTGAFPGSMSKKYGSTLGSMLGIGSAEDIDQFDSLTNSLVLDLGNQLKGSQIALGKLKIIEQSKPSLSKVKGGNIKIIDDMKNLADLAEQKARFISKSIKENVNAIDAEDAFGRFADEKLEVEGKGKKFTKKPEDFLEGMNPEGGESSTEGMPGEINLESMSDEELERIAAGK